MSQEPSSVDQSATALIAQLNMFDAAVLENSQEERYKAIVLSKKLLAELEGPINRATELVFKPFSSIAARIAVGLNLFEPIVARGDVSISSQELADVTGGEAMLICARAYFMHHILHDWSDKYCHCILKQVHDAMTPGYSRLLIHELILPDVGAADFQARFDLTMMTVNSGMERSRVEWRKLLENAGFKVLELWEHLDADGIVEAEVAA